MMYMQFFGVIFLRNNKILNNSGKISKQIQVASGERHWMTFVTYLSFNLLACIYYL